MRPALSNSARSWRFPGPCCTPASTPLLHYFEYATPPRARLAERLAHLVPGNTLKKVACAVTGSEAIELAIKLARWYTGAPGQVTCYGNYHGISGGTIGLTGKAAQLYEKSLLVSVSFPRPNSFP